MIRERQLSRSPSGKRMNSRGTAVASCLLSTSEFAIDNRFDGSTANGVEHRSLRARCARFRVLPIEGGWPIASFRGDAKVDRYRGIADHARTCRWLSRSRMTHSGSGIRRSTYNCAIGIQFHRHSFSPSLGVQVEQRARRAATGGYSGGRCRGLLPLDRDR